MMSHSLSALLACTRRWGCAAAIVALSGACAARSAPSTTDTLGVRGPVAGTSDALRVPNSAPHLTSLSPMTIALGRGEVPTLILTGRDFVAGARGTFGTGGNTIRVGPASFDAVAADSSGTVIRFALPLNYTDTTAKGRPQSFTPGDYPISVVTPKGTSNSLTLTMIQ